MFHVEFCIEILAGFGRLFLLKKCVGVGMNVGVGPVPSLLALDLAVAVALAVAYAFLGRSV